MKILLATDAAGHYRSALTLLARFAFPRVELSLLHVDEKASFPVALPHLPTFSGGAEAVESHGTDRKVLELAIEEAEAAGFLCKGMYEAGRPIDQILLQSNQLPADLVAIGSRNRSSLTTAILGGVGQGLAADSSKSFLVSHGDVAPAGGLRCVFATDHSPYADLALSRLLDWQPKGIEEITLFTAIEPDSRRGHRGTTDLADLSDPKVLAARITKFERQIEQEGIKATARFGAGHATQAIDAFVTESRADLLIVGARGHGFVERMLLGSVATTLVNSAKYPVLIVRPEGR